MSQPASSSWRTCSIVAFASAVAVLVIDCTVIGASPPTSTSPTRILRLARRSIARQEDGGMGFGGHGEGK